MIRGLRIKLGKQQSFQNHKNYKIFWDTSKKTVKDLYEKNFKPLKKLKKISRNGNFSHALELIE